MRVTLATAIGAAALLLATAAAAGSATIVIPDCLGHPEVRPKQIVFTCADANFGARRLAWVGWGGQVAVGLGQAYANDCVPDCASGHVRFYRVAVITSGRQRCHGRLAYRTVTWAFVGRFAFSGGRAWDDKPEPAASLRQLSSQTVVQNVAMSRASAPR